MGDGLRKKLNVRHISYDFECSRNAAHFEYGWDTPYLYSWYVEIELMDGRPITFIVQLHWNEQSWCTQSCIETSGETAPTVLVSFPDRKADTIDEVVDALSTLTSELVDAGNTPNLWLGS